MAKDISYVWEKLCEGALQILATRDESLRNRLLLAKRKFLSLINPEDFPPSIANLADRYSAAKQAMHNLEDPLHLPNVEELSDLAEEFYHICHQVFIAYAGWLNRLNS